MYFDRKCKITFICHGATIYSEENRFSDKDNYPPLNENGVEEVEKICEYTSTAARCVQTAKYVSKVYKKLFEYIELPPRNCGSFSGMAFEQVEVKTPDLLQRLIYEPDKSTPDDAESITDFINRVSAKIDKIVSENTGNRVIIVTHPDVIKAAICDALDIPHSSFQHIYIKTGSATQISYFESWKSLIYSDYTPL